MLFMNSTGNKIRLTIFGQSHSNAIGCVIDGLDAGVKIDIDTLQKFLDRRAPGNNDFSTPRKEKDKVEIISGLVNGYTCGAPLCAIIQNTNVKKNDYDNLAFIPRPSHSDYTAFIKFAGFNDKTGGGQFSGRLTAPLCIAGGICIELLKKQGININARIKSIYNITDDTIWDGKKLDSNFPVLDKDKSLKMQACILSAREEQDSVGGVVECMITGVKAGLGNPMFDGIENVISKNIFAIPAVKGIEFGAGFEITKLRGSQANDPFCINKDKKITTISNNSGGIQGGITNGMPIVFRVPFKPTPSISKLQKSVDLEKNENVSFSIKGRHDPCIVLRAVPVVEAVAALSIYDFL